MRTAVCSAFLSLWCAAALAGGAVEQTAATVAPAPAWKWVWLNGTADLEHLRETNLDHYLRARKILAAANELCAPGASRTYRARFDDADPRCEALMWMTSYPPKKLLSFHLDDIHYLALVSVTDSGKLHRIDDANR